MESQQITKTWSFSSNKVLDTFGDAERVGSRLPVVVPQAWDVKYQWNPIISPLADLESPDRYADIRPPFVEPAAAINLDAPRTAPIQIWEGEVLSVDRNSGNMRVLLSAKMGNIADHTGEISLEWVAEQDADLVCPGAVFYWTLYKETRRGSIRNSQELRFRRLPNWSKSQIESIRLETERLTSHL